MSGEVASISLLFRLALGVVVGSLSMAADAHTVQVFSLSRGRAEILTVVEAKRDASRIETTARKTNVWRRKRIRKRSRRLESRGEVEAGKNKRKQRDATVNQLSEVAALSCQKV